MHLSHRLGSIVLALVVWAAVGTVAEAQVGGTPFALGYGFSGNGLYGMMNSQPPPYYAVFPPVYYSHPVARPYGYSPFAYPPGYITPSVGPVPPKEVANPYVPRERKASTTDRTAAAPKVFVNPYVVQRRAAELASRTLA
ncbi:MAG TPA: hypothetical protein PK867_23160, partial [Pirellulales bacterium]|nr:hypothetical protein [Pirellulales bacterium]